MPERPIIFSAPMVRALLDGRKTQTRRALKPQPEWVKDGVMCWRGVATTIAAHRLPYRIGASLWVREAWAQPALMPVQYRADPPIRCGHWNGELGPWSSPIHMPRWASRITLRVTGVRVQRLHDISEEDALAEGLERVGHAWGFTGIPGSVAMQPRTAFRVLWDHLHGPDAWNANPWVAAITFEHQAGRGCFKARRNKRG